MSVMAKPKPDKTTTDTSKRPNRAGVPLSVYIDEDIDEAMRNYMESYNDSHPHRATLRSTVELALKALLKSEGHYPPKKKNGGH